MDQAPAVVLDNGSGLLKAGVTGSDKIPKVIIPNYVGTPKFDPVMLEAPDRSSFVGKFARDRRGLLRLNYPVEHGIINDWQAMQQVWKHVYTDKDCLNLKPEDHPLLLTEAPFNPRKNREMAAKFFFEDMGVPAMYIAMQGVLSLYANGKVTGLVLDSGDGVTHAVPVVEGFAINNAIMRVDLGGRDVTRYLQLLLRQEGHIFKSSSDFETVRTIKEQACKVSGGLSKTEHLDDKKTPYVLPDGSKIEIGNSLSKAPEILFKPEIIGEEYPGAGQLLANSLARCDTDLRRALSNDIVLSGGTTMMQGYEKRLLADFKKLAPREVRVRILISRERKYFTWLGGSILASLPAFRNLWVERSEFQDYGESIFYRKGIITT